jgi:hypothetical protein
VWVDELRLGRAVRDAGVATSLQAELDAAGVLDARLTLTDRGAFFRQLRDDPSYQTDRRLSLSSTLRLDRWTPAEWGVELPLTLSLDRLGQDPFFLANSDVRADRLGGLRPNVSRRTRVGLSFRKRTRTANPLLGFLLEGMDARLAYVSSSGSTVTTESDAHGLDAGLGWTRRPERQDVALVPDALEGLVRALLPGFLEDGVVDARLRWSPERVAVGSSYLRRDSRIFRYERIIELPGDTAVLATFAPRETLESAADVRFRPLESLVADLTFQSVRDLLPPEEAVTDGRVQELIRGERNGLAGVDLGWETNRNLRTRVGFGPQIVPWLRNDLTWTSVYRTDRNANFLLTTVEGADSTLVLTRNARGQRDWTASFSLDPGAMVEAGAGGGTGLGGPVGGEAPGMAGPGAAAAGGGAARGSDASRGAGAAAALQSLLGAVRPILLTYRDGVTARFNRDPIGPDLGFQLGWGASEDFRFLGRDTAATLVDEATWTASTGARLAGGVTVDVAYQRTEAVTLDVRADRTLRQRRWPDVAVSLPPIAPPALLGMDRVTLTSGYERSEREIVFGGPGQQRRARFDVLVPVDVSVTWRAGVVTRYRGTFRDGESVDPTGGTERIERTHRLSVSSTFRPPFGLSERLERPVRLSLLVGYTEERDCRSTAIQPGCVPFVDQLRRSLSLSLDTRAGGVEVGLQASYDQRQSFIGLKTGAAQFQFGVFGQLDLAAGMLPTRPF